MSGKLLDTYPAGSTIYALFDTFGSSGQSITLTGLAVTDVEIFKDGSTTQRASDAGIALLDTDGIDFDSITGIHGISIDLSDNTDSGFYAAGSQYTVVISSVTIDSQTVSFILGSFRIVAAEGTAGYPAVDMARISNDATAADNLETMLDGTGGQTLSLKQLNIVNSAGSAIVATSSGGNGHGMVLTGNGFGSGLSASGGATGHGILGQGGESSGAGIRAVGDAGAGMSLAGASNNPGLVSTGQGSGAGIRAVGGATGNGMELVGGSSSGDGLDCSVTSGAEIDANITGNLSGSVGSVTGNVGGNVTGTIGGLTQAALADFFDTDSGTDYSSAVAGSVVKEIADNAGGSSLTVGDIADAVWDEALSGHTTAGTAGKALSDAGSAGDPWSTALPGSYTAGQAGYIIGTNLDGTVSSRASQTSVDTVDSNVDAILVDTAEIGAAGAGLTAVPWNAAWDAEVQSECADALAAYDPPTNAEMVARTLASADYATAANQSTIAGYIDTEVASILAAVDTEVAAIKAVTDNLPDSGALTSLATASALATVDSNVDSILADTGTDGVVIADKTGFRLSSTGVDDILDEVVEGTYTMRQLLRGISAALLGEVSGAATTEVTIRNASDSKSVIVATVDSDGNRSAVTLDLT